MLRCGQDNAFHTCMKKEDMVRTSADAWFELTDRTKPNQSIHQKAHWETPCKAYSKANYRYLLSLLRLHFLFKTFFCVSQVLLKVMSVSESLLAGLTCVTLASEDAHDCVDSDDNRDNGYESLITLVTMMNVI